MSGHSKWAKTHRQKAVTDAKRGASFTKLGKLITIAAREGSADPESNFKLRLAVEKARAGNMPKDNIERAIKRGAGKGAGEVLLEEITYEAFGPDGSVFIIEVITDNKNRALADLKTVLNKNGGQLGGPNSVLWQFTRQGLITIAPPTGDPDEAELALIDAGADNIQKGDEDWEIYTPLEQLPQVEANLKNLNFSIKESSLAYVAKDELTVTDPGLQEKITKLYNAVDDLDDVNNLYTNASW